MNSSPLADASRRLSAAGIDSADSDAAWLYAQALGVERKNLALAGAPTQQQLEAFEAAVGRRERREPLQHILGVAGFRYLELAVGPGVFVPRPETETLVDFALKALHSKQKRVVDLCTGSGAIALAVATESGGVTMYAIEASEDAAAWTRRNIDAHRSELVASGSSIEFFVCDVAEALETPLSRLLGSVDLVTCNPPYIPQDAIPRDIEVREYDPAIALYGGADGLEVVRTVIDVAARLLREGGTLLIEHGDLQGESGGELGVPNAVRQHGDFAEIADHDDLTGRPRVTSAVRAAE